MNRQIIAALVVFASFLLGGIAQWLWEPSPDFGDNLVTVRDAWRTPESGMSEVAASDGIWNRRYPLGSPPPPPPPPAPPPPPPPPPPAVPAGVLAQTDGTYQAVFIDPVVGQVTLDAGDELPSGGKVLRITRTAVEWLNGKGQRFRHNMLADPAPFNTYGRGMPPAPLPAPSSRRPTK